MVGRVQLLNGLLEPFPWDQIVLPLAAAEDAIARLDERLAKSPIRAGWIARTHFSDACASLWLEGSLVDLTELVLHDAGMNLRPPTHELTIAHHVLRIRRKIATADPGWALTPKGLDILRGKPKRGAEQGAMKEIHSSPEEEAELVEKSAADNGGDETLEAAFKALDAVMTRADLRMAGETLRWAVEPEIGERDPLVYDPDWNEEARLAQWRGCLGDAQNLPPALSTALSLLAWDDIEPLETVPWLGRLLAAAYLQMRGKTKAHLACLSISLRAIPRERRRARDQTTRLLAIIEALTVGAEAGLKDHDRWITERERLTRKINGHRATSMLPRLIDYLMTCPIVSAGMIAHELKITPRAAQNLASTLGVREVTGRERYRAWAIL